MNKFIFFLLIVLFTLNTKLKAQCDNLNNFYTSYNEMSDVKNADTAITVKNNLFYNLRRTDNTTGKPLCDISYAYDTIYLKSVFIKSGNIEIKPDSIKLVGSKISLLSFYINENIVQKNTDKNFFLIGRTYQNDTLVFDTINIFGLPKTTVNTTGCANNSTITVENKTHGLLIFTDSANITDTLRLNESTSLPYGKYTVKSTNKIFDGLDSTTISYKNPTKTNDTFNVTGNATSIQVKYDTAQVNAIYGTYRNLLPVYYDFNNSGPGLYKAFKIAGIGCADTTNVAVYVVPTVKISGNTFKACHGETVTINGPTGHNTYTQLNYTWYNNTNDILSTDTFFTATTSGTYHVTTSNNNDSTSEPLYFTVYIGVNLDSIAKLLDTVYFVHDTIDNKKSYKYTGGLDNNVSIEYRPTSEDSVTVYLRDKNNADCEYKTVYTFSTKVVKTTTGIVDTKTVNVTAYPNPFNDVLNFEADCDGTYYITDMAGRTVKSNSFTYGLNTVETSDINSGTYILRIVSGSSFTTVKIVK